ncbi:ergothioneine biosynthesis protein EgtB [Aliikangiella maris]|uniref:Ergothioneine biosynthesis protein EgtB n=2 Tax=Aliikangiella maris TaxID=3162458 RepID=A0ABV3MJ96_9GAMM
MKNTQSIADETQSNESTPSLPDTVQLISSLSNISELTDVFLSTRQSSLTICQNLSAEDLQAQSMPDASPLKWHLAHTSWAFETFILKPHKNNYQVFDKDYEYLFNSYYNAVGQQFPRPQRGLLTRPDLSTIFQYRKYIDEQMLALLTSPNAHVINLTHQQLEQLVLLFINHEQQHQELMLTDLKHLLSINPTYPSVDYIETLTPSKNKQMLEIDAGLFSIGHNNETFYFDNEGPRHQFYVNAFRIATELVSNAEYLAFIEDNGYQTPDHWLSEAWQKINANNINHPLYWVKKENQWFEYTLSGLVPLNLHQPVKHISYFEANAFANWCDKRLPTEQEWEVAARNHGDQLQQLFNQLWQWTSSSYAAYPGFTPPPGAIGEYNGKFMVNQYVLRGGSIVTPAGHIRCSYRNFFYPDACWQYSGIRLAETI